MLNYIAAMVDASKSRRFIKDSESLERVILSHISFSDVAGISVSSLQDTLDLLFGRSGSELLSGKPISSGATDESKTTELKEKLQRTDRALERLKKAYLFDDDGMDE